MTKQQNYVFILFGATGDLALKKLIPALYQAVRYNDNLQCGRIICVARSDKTTQEYLQEAKQYVQESEAVDFDDIAWKKFSKMVQYFDIDVTKTENFWTDQKWIFFAYSP